MVVDQGKNKSDSALQLLLNIPNPNTAIIFFFILKIAVLVILSSNYSSRNHIC